MKIKPAYIFAVPFLLVTPVTAYVIFSIWFHWVFLGVWVMPLVENGPRLAPLVIGNIFSVFGAIPLIGDLCDKRL